MPKMSFNQTLFERLTTIKNFFWLFVLIAILYSSCTSKQIYEHSYSLNEAWSADSGLAFTFNIEDKSEQYDMFYTIEYNDSYPFNNLYIKYNLTNTGTGDTIATSLDNMQLFDAITGKPLGSGSGHYRQSIRFVKKGKFIKSGQYKLICKQYMRQNPLVGIDAFGIKISTMNEDE
jgi:gliding motility-associated lipoprotein GldH